MGEHVVSVDKAKRGTDMTAWWVYLGHKHGLALEDALMPALFGIETYWQAVELWRAMGGAAFAHQIPKDLAHQSLIRPEWIGNTPVKPPTLQWPVEERWWGIMGSASLC